MRQTLFLTLYFLEHTTKATVFSLDSSVIVGMSAMMCEDCQRPGDSLQTFAMEIPEDAMWNEAIKSNTLSDKEICMLLFCF